MRPLALACTEAHVPGQQFVHPKNEQMWTRSALSCDNEGGPTEPELL